MNTTYIDQDIQIKYNDKPEEFDILKNETSNMTKYLKHNVLSIIKNGNKVDSDELEKNMNQFVQQYVNMVNVCNYKHDNWFDENFEKDCEKINKNINNYEKKIIDFKLNDCLICMD
jgi:hypothetical protein